MFLIMIDARFSRKSHICLYCLNYDSSRDMCRYIECGNVVLTSPSSVTESDCLSRYRYLISPSICVESNNQLAIC